MISVEPGYGAGDALESEIEGVFSASGVLSKSPDFEYRAEQQEMAVAVARALEQKSVLVVEAGTGVGKSLAYMIPAIQHALEKGRKAIISTHTINLQEQLMGKDIPLVKKLVGQDFDAILMKDAVGPDNQVFRTDINAFTNAIERHFSDPTKGNPIIDLAGLTNSQRRLVQRRIGKMNHHGKEFSLLAD